MKLKYLLLPLIIVVIGSCSKEKETTMVVAEEEEMEIEDEGTTDPPPQLKLATVLIEQLLIIEEDIYRFSDEQLTSFNDKTATYEEGRVVRLERDNQRESFVYDNQGRLIGYSDFEGVEKDLREITYLENEIRVQQQYITPTEVETSSVTFFLDDNNRIVSEEYTDPFDQVFTAELSYDEAGNIVEARVPYTIQYSYNSTDVSSSYRFLELLFGSHWKNNTILYKGRFIKLISDGLLVELANTYPIESQFSVLTNTFAYEFDNNGNLLLRSEFNNDGVLDTRTTYEYE